MKKNTLIIILLLSVGMLFSQEAKKQQWKFKDHIVISGYIKYLPSVSFVKGSDTKFDHLIHNRININAYLTDYLSAKVAIRNRIFFGETVKATPNFGELIAVDNGELDLSFLVINKKKLVAHSIIDRAFVDYSKGSWQLRLGRQRINWGINLAWNTNDLFNAYNIIDFDYEERAGTDALRLQYSLKNATLELAYAPGKDIDHSVIGARYAFNSWNYDFQLLAANFNTDIALGTGWAGNIKNAGFKGEATYFLDKNNVENTLSISTSLDYFFRKGMYLNLSMLYTSNGENTFNPNVFNFISSTLSAKNLMPTKYSYLVQVSKEFNPRFKSSLLTIYGQGMDILFFMPSIDYAIRENWDLNLTGQLFYARQQDSFGSINNSLFLRLQYSF